MPSPFAGMDPYLENPAYWPQFHHEMILVIINRLNKDIASAGGRYQTHLRERRYSTNLSPSESTTEQREEFIEIHERHNGELVTLVDLVSPANKMTDPGRKAYLESRQQAKLAKANIVEIDLVLHGQPMLDYSREGLEEWNYAVTVTRSTQPERYEIYTALLQKRLPRFRLPLAAGTRDTVVDLQTVFTRAYGKGIFEKQIDYSTKPAVPLSDEKHRYVAGLLKEAHFTDEEIAMAAYLIWKEQGCPHGRDQDHWRLAIERLRSKRN